MKKNYLQIISISKTI